jgi:hypothetical protein
MDDIFLSPELDGTLGMPTFEHSCGHQNFWEERFRENWHHSECKLGTKCKFLRKHQDTTKRNFLLRVVATQIPQNPSTLLASPISGTRFLLRVVVYNIPRFYQILGEIFCFCFARDDWNFTGI